MEGGGQGPCPPGEVPSEDMEGGGVGPAVSERPRKQGLMATSLTGRWGPPALCLSFKGLASATGSTSDAASSAAPGRAAGVWEHKGRLFLAFFFRRLLAHPAGMGWHFRTRSLELVADFLELVAGRSKLRPFYHTK